MRSGLGSQVAHYPPPGGGGATITFEGSVHSDSGGNTQTSCVCDLPDSPDAGDLLVLIYCHTTFGPRIDTPPAGWTELIDEALSGDFNGKAIAVFYKISDGTETTATVVIGDGRFWGSNAYRFSTTGTFEPPEVSAIVQGDSTDPNPPSLSPTWGAVPWECIAVSCSYGTDAMSSAPSGYSDLIQNASVVDEYEPVVSSAHKATSGASEDPGAFTLSSQERWGTITIGVGAS